ncbi:MAG: N-acetylmuramoyl-L-alanine amidase [Paludibacter sp.]
MKTIFLAIFVKVKIHAKPMYISTKRIIQFIFIMLIISVNAQSQIVDKKMSVGFRTAQNRSIDVLIIHSVFNNSGGDFYDIDLIIKQFSKYGVSSHYLIGCDGVIYRLVDENNVAYHAGKSSLPDGRTAVNSCSLGIELVCSFTESVTEMQLESLVKLTKDLQARYKLKYILRHSDIAPDRKTDPWNFDWEHFNQILEINTKQLK